jgi:hypothetical protein
MPCRSQAVPLPCRASLIYKYDAAPLSFSDIAASFVKVRVVAGNNRNYRIGILLITTFVELRVVTGRSRKRAGRPHAVSGGPMVIHTCHTMPSPCRCDVSLRRGFQSGMVMAWHGRGITCVNQIRPTVQIK